MNGAPSPNSGVTRRRNHIGLVGELDEVAVQYA